MPLNETKASSCILLPRAAGGAIHILRMGRVTQMHGLAYACVWGGWGLLVMYVRIGTVGGGVEKYVCEQGGGTIFPDFAYVMYGWPLIWPIP